VELIEYDKIEILRIGDDRLIESVLPGHQQFKHHKVCEQDIGPQLPNPFSFIRFFLSGISLEGRSELLG
jgi:hypothetical protein